jgi:hypothetical protein
VDRGRHRGAASAKGRSVTEALACGDRDNAVGPREEGLEAMRSRLVKEDRVADREVCRGVRLRETRREEDAAADVVHLLVVSSEELAELLVREADEVVQPYCRWSGGRCRELCRVDGRVGARARFKTTQRPERRAAQST